MKMTIERVENGYILEYEDETEDKNSEFGGPVRLVFMDDPSRYNRLGFDAECLRDALSTVAAEFSIYGGSSDFDKSVVRVITDRGDELDPEEDSNE